MRRTTFLEMVFNQNIFAVSSSLDFRYFTVLILYTCWFMFTLFPFILQSFKYSTWHLVLHIAQHSMHPQCAHTHATNKQTSKQKWELTVISVHSICLLITRHFNVKKNKIKVLVCMTKNWTDELWIYAFHLERSKCNSSVFCCVAAK